MASGPRKPQTSNNRAAGALIRRRSEPAIRQVAAVATGTAALSTAASSAEPCSTSSSAATATGAPRTERSRMSVSVSSSRSAYVAAGIGVSWSQAAAWPTASGRSPRSSAIRSASARSTPVLKCRTSSTLSARSNTSTSVRPGRRAQRRSREVTRTWPPGPAAGSQGSSSSGSSALSKSSSQRWYGRPLASASRTARAVLVTSPSVCRPRPGASSASFCGITAGCWAGTHHSTS